MSRRFLWLLPPLLAVCATALFGPRTRVPYTWDWRQTRDLPFSEAPRVSADEAVAVRILDGPDAAWAAEAVWQTGALGVRIGPPSSFPDEVWVVPGCDRAAAAAEHLARGGSVIAWPACPELTAALDLPAPTPWEQTGAVAVLDLGRVSSGPLALPPAGAEWSGGEAIASRRGGGSVVVRASRVVLVGFDLAAFQRDLRLGLPALADVDSDGVHGVKPSDLRPFPWPPETWRIPSADVWAELVVVLAGELRHKALSRVWPLPTPAPSVLVLTSDQDFSDQAWADAILARSEARGGEATLLLTSGTRQDSAAAVDGGGGETPSASALRRARGWGHGFGMHPNGWGLPSARTADVIRHHHERLSRLQPDGELRAARNHGLAWWGWDGPIPLYEELGLWVELNFVSIGPTFGGPGFGFGAARPVRPPAPDGTLRRIFSWPTQIEDDVLVGQFPYSARLSSPDAVARSSELLDIAIAHRVPLVANIHPLGAAMDQGELLDGLLDAAASRGVPIMSAERAATSAWDRLRRVTGGAAPSSVPQWSWEPGASCPKPIAPSALEALGCLEALIE